MFSKDSLAVDIGSSYTKVLFGDKQRIKFCGLIKTPEGSVIDNNIINSEAIKNAVQAFLNQNYIKAEDISFAIHGQDIIIRHVELPIMDEKGLMKAVEWEIGQYLPENGNNYFTDYEVLSKTNTKEKKAYNLLVVAAPKGKINKYIELSYGLGMKLKAVDISANCVSRVFRETVKESMQGISAGVIDIGFKNSNIIILDRGRLFIEREVPFGIKNAIYEISKTLGIDEQQAYSYLFEKFSFSSINPDVEVERNIQKLFEDALASFDKVIQFYTTGKTQKHLDKIYLIGGGCEIPGIISFTSEYLGAPAYIVDSINKIPVKAKLPEGCDLKVYVNALGLLLRKE